MSTIVIIRDEKVNGSGDVMELTIVVDHLVDLPDRIAKAAELFMESKANEEVKV